ncbi:hypothetical protein SISNIDRAFT_49349 [Sistotremastrum niveocremeum HHB9708]|uniref:Uncharacterized protein n=1 Tax=Sistotremastrum niveocremeum HHB9708 TaxID=1314777 RepID=A0A164VXY5_9AGAM|nr:hypothetical protein SISNIDRAFT_49349 [Sistotremastrum niveocremeum HHB9708]
MDGRRVGDGRWGDDVECTGSKDLVSGYNCTVLPFIPAFGLVGVSLIRIIARSRACLALFGSSGALPDKDQTSNWTVLIGRCLSRVVALVALFNLSLSPVAAWPTSPSTRPPPPRRSYPVFVVQHRPVSFPAHPQTSAAWPPSPSSVPDTLTPHPLSCSQNLPRLQPSLQTRPPSLPVQWSAPTVRRPISPELSFFSVSLGSSFAFSCFRRHINYPSMAPRWRRKIDMQRLW